MVGTLAIAVAIIALASLPFAPAWRPTRIGPILHPDRAALADAGWGLPYRHWELIRLAVVSAAALVMVAAGGPVLLGLGAAFAPSIAVRLRAQAAHAAAIRLQRLINQLLTIYILGVAGAAGCIYEVDNTDRGPGVNHRLGSAHADLCGACMPSAQTSSGFSTGSISRFTTTGSWPLRISTHSSASESRALISWCGTNGGT